MNVPLRSRKTAGLSYCPFNVSITPPPQILHSLASLGTEERRVIDFFIGFHPEFAVSSPASDGPPTQQTTADIYYLLFCGAVVPRHNLFACGVRVVCKGKLRNQCRFSGDIPATNHDKSDPARVSRKAWGTLENVVCHPGTGTPCPHHPLLFETRGHAQRRTIRF